MSIMANTERGMTFKEPVPLSLASNGNQEQSVDTVRIEELHEGSEMYDGIAFDFENAGLKVDKIERLENLRLKKRYINERDVLLDERKAQDPDYKLNEKYLYHGTSSKKAQICEEGLDQRMSKEGCFGRGVYFSDFPKKCVKYAEKGGCTESIILLMRVILGDAKVYPRGEKDRDLKREPEKVQPYVGYRFYDSVKGCPVNHNEFVVYESRRALVECIVTYSKLPNPSSAETPKSSDSKTAPTTAEDSDTSSDEDEPATTKDNDTDTTDDEDESGNQEQEVPEDPNPWKLSPEDSFLSQLMSDFAARTGERDKHTVETFLNMVDLDVDRAVGLYNQTVTNEGPFSRDDVVASEKLISSQPHPNQMDPERLKKMSPEDQEVAIKCLVDNLLDSMGRDLSNEKDRNLAKKYLEAADLDFDEAMCMYISTIAARA